MTNTGIFNPNSMNRNYLNDGELASPNLSERDLLLVKVDTARTVLNSIPAGMFPIFRTKMESQLAAAERTLHDYDEQAAFAHIDSLMGDERATINDMDNGIELFMNNSSKSEEAE